VLAEEFQAYTQVAASDEITWRKPRTVLIVTAWSVTNASVILNVFLHVGGFATINLFLGGSQTFLWFFLLLLFSISVFAGMLLEDIKSIVLGAFEAIALTVLLTYAGMVLPILTGNAPGFYLQEIYTSSMSYIFSIFFPLIPLSFIMGAIIGGILEDWLF
jgi:hypothetical protein